MATERRKLKLSSKRRSYQSTDLSIQEDIPYERSLPDLGSVSAGRGVHLSILSFDESLYLGQALLIYRKIQWKITVAEPAHLHAETVDIAATGPFEPFLVMHNARVPVEPLTSWEACQQKIREETEEDNAAAWRVYSLSKPLSSVHEAFNQTTYVISLTKPHHWSSQYKVVRFFFRGVYSMEENCTWEQISSGAITIDVDEPRWKELAFTTLHLNGQGYEDIIMNPKAQVDWNDFVHLIETHCHAVTGCRRKLCDKVNYLSPLHVDSIMRMTQSDADHKVNMKRLRYFCHLSQEGGVQPPLTQIESAIQRYPKSWENGSIAGVISSSVAKQYLLGHGHPVGSFFLRMQFNSPSEICASSVQIHPQSGATFVDHLTISRHVAPNDQKLMEYLAHSPVHQILLPAQQLCAPSAFPVAISLGDAGPSAYRTTDQQANRTNNILQQMQKPLSLPTGSRRLTQSCNGLHHLEESNKPTPSPTPAPIVTFFTPAESQNLATGDKPFSTPSLVTSHPSLDPKVLQWLRELFGDQPVLQDICDIFEAERVTFSSLEMLENDDLKEMNIPIGPRKEMVQAIEAMNRSS